MTRAGNASHTWLFSLCPTRKGWLSPTPAGALGLASSPPASCQKGTKAEPTPSHTARCLLMPVSLTGTKMGLGQKSGSMGVQKRP